MLVRIEILWFPLNFAGYSDDLSRYEIGNDLQAMLLSVAEVVGGCLSISKARDTYKM